MLSYFSLLDWLLLMLSSFYSSTYSFSLLTLSSFASSISSFSLSTVGSISMLFYFAYTFNEFYSSLILLLSSSNSLTFFMHGHFLQQQRQGFSHQIWYIISQVVKFVPLYCNFINLFAITTEVIWLPKKFIAPVTTIEIPPSYDKSSRIWKAFLWCSTLSVDKKNWEPNKTCLSSKL